MSANGQAIIKINQIQKVHFSIFIVFMESSWFGKQHRHCERFSAKQSFQNQQIASAPPYGVPKSGTKSASQ
jgi:hypothetical protein